MTRLEAFQRLDEALTAARDRAPDWLEIAQAYTDRLTEEFDATAQRVSGDVETTDFEAALIVGVETRQNVLEPRHYQEARDEFGTRARRDNTRPAGGVELSLLLPAVGGLSLGAHGTLQLPADRKPALEAFGVAVLGAFGLWAGRRTIGFGSSSAGSVVLSGKVPFDGAGLFLTEGARLPGFLRILGVLRVETAVTRLDRAGEVRTPWFFALRASLSPHPRLRVGLNRAAVFGGRHELVPSITFTRVAKAILALDNDEVGRGNFEDQTASFDLWIAPAMGPVPVVIYGEWGIGDLAAQKTEMPALVGGVTVSGFPGARWLSLGVEGTSLHKPTGNRRPWYDHRVFGTWTDEGTIRGHELGGTGTEVRVYTAADPWDARLRVEVSGFGRNRKSGNLFAPEREGSSSGLGWTVLVRLSPSLDIETSGVVESGSGWTEGEAFLGSRLYF